MKIVRELTTIVAAQEHTDESHPQPFDRAYCSKSETLFFAADKQAS